MRDTRKENRGIRGDVGMKSFLALSIAIIGGCATFHGIPGEIQVTRVRCYKQGEAIIICPEEIKVPAVFARIMVPESALRGWGFDPEKDRIKTRWCIKDTKGRIIEWAVGDGSWRCCDSALHTANKKYVGFAFELMQKVSWLLRYTSRWQPPQDLFAEPDRSVVLLEGDITIGKKEFRVGPIEVHLYWPLEFDLEEAQWQRILWVIQAGREHGRSVALERTDTRATMGVRRYEEGEVVIVVPRQVRVPVIFARILIPKAALQRYRCAPQREGVGTWFHVRETTGKLWLEGCGVSSWNRQNRTIRIRGKEYVEFGFELTKKVASMLDASSYRQAAQKISDKCRYNVVFLEGGVKIGKIPVEGGITVPKKEFKIGSIKVELYWPSDLDPGEGEGEGFFSIEAKEPR